jgi:hypothetical protein
MVWKTTVPVQWLPVYTINNIYIIYIACDWQTFDRIAVK